MLLKRNIALILSACMLMTSCDQNNDKDAAAQNKAPTVSVMQVTPKDIPLSFEFSARAQGSKETEVRARVGGILLKRNFVEGSRVEEGQILFEIDPAPYKLALDQAKAQLAKEEAKLLNAKSQWERTEKLYKQKYASEKTLDQARSNMDSLAAAVQLAQSEVDTAQLNLDYTTVTAPISGMTSMEAQSEGSLISPTGSAGLLTKIIQLDPIYIIFSVSENELLAFSDMIAKGQISDPKGKSEIAATLKFSNDTVYEQEGAINFINPSIDEATGTIKLRAVFPNPQGKVRPGQFVRLMMKGLTRKEALVVPQEAVMQGANGAYIYRVNNENKIEMVSVRTGLTVNKDYWIIDEGINPNDKVIYTGLLKLRPGMQVTPLIKTEPQL